jgi:DNA polymerase-1
MSETMTYTAAEVFERWGVTPAQVVDFKAIKGDPSDNIPGVPGIGDKGAAELISTFGTIEAILERWDEVPEKYKKKIEPAVDSMKLSKWLATIKRDCEVSYDFEPFVLTQAEFAAGKEFLERFEMRSHAKNIQRVLGPYVEGAATSEPVVEVVQQKLEFATREVGSFIMLKSTVNSQLFGLHFAALQTDDLFDTEAERAYVAVGHEVLSCSREDGLRLLSTFPSQAIVHDAKPLYKAAKKFDQAVGFDALLAGYVLQSGRAGYVLGDLVQGYTDLVVPSTPEETAASLLHLQKAMLDRLEKEGQTSVLQTIELPLTPILAEMEVLGIRTSKSQLHEFSKELAIAIEASTKRVYELAGQEFTIGSPKQLGEILFDKI